MQFKKIDQLEHMDVNQMVDIIGIVEQVCRLRHAWIVVLAGAAPGTCLRRA